MFEHNFLYCLKSKFSAILWIPRGFSLKVFKVFIHFIFLSVLLSACHPGGIASERRFPTYQIGKGDLIQTDSLTEALIKPYRAPLDTKMQEVIVLSLHPATKGLPESSLGNLVCDLLQSEAEISKQVKSDACLMNTGGLRVELPEGEITRSMVFELMPFENELVLAEITGSNLRLILDQVAARGGDPVSGIHMKINNGKARNILIGDSALEDTHIYRLLCSDYILHGGDHFNIPPLISEKVLNLKVRDALLQAMIRSHSSGTPLNPKKDGRIVTE